VKIPQILTFGTKEISGPAVTARKLFWFFVGVAFVPIVIISGAAYFYGSAALETKLIEGLTALTQAKANELNLFIEKLNIRAADWSSDGKIRKDAELISQGKPLGEELSFYLKEKKLPIDPTVALVDVLDTNGIVIASSDQMRLGKDEGKERISFREALAAPFGEAVLTPTLVVEEDELAGVPMLHLSAPLVSAETGNTVGVLLLHIKNDELNNVLSIEQGETLETYLVNPEKLMITSSRFIPDAVLKQSVNTLPVRACLDHGKDYQGQHLDYRGEQVFGVSKCLRDGLGVLITEIDRSEAFSGLSFFRNVMLLLLAAVLAGAAVYGFFAGKGLMPRFPTTTTTTTTIIIIIIIIIGVVFSLFFTKTLEQFVWRVKTEPTFELVQGQAHRHIGKAEYLVNWQKPEAERRFEDFVSELKTSLPPVAAIKIYDNQAVLVWADLAKKNIGQKEEAEDVLETLAGKQKVESAEKEIQKELGAPHLLEIYTPIYLEEGKTPAGVVEIYFDTSDLVAFTRKVRVYVWGIIAAALAAIYGLLLSAFRKQNAQIRRQAEELSNIIDKSPLGIYTINKNGIIDSFNPKMVELAGAKDAKAVIGLNALELPTYKAVGLDKFFREGLQGKPFTTEVEYTSYTGHKTTFRHYFGVPIFGTDGKSVERLLLMVEDITERKKLEAELQKYTKNLEQIVAQRTAELKEEKDKLQTTLESIGDGAFSIEASGQIVFFNKAAEEISGYKAADIIGKQYQSILRFVLEKDSSPNYKFIEEVFSKGVISRITDDTVLIAKNEERVFVEGNAAPLKDSEGKVRGAVIIFRDVTKAKEIEKTKINFISIASHQLRTPLSALRWIAEMFLNGDLGALTENQKEFLNNMYKSIRQLLNLVNIFLATSRIEEGRIDITPIPTDITALTKEIIDGLKPLITAKNLHLTMVDQPLPKINLEPEMFRQVMLNLLSNAVNYTPNDGRITVQFELKADHVICSVEDSGIGIPKKDQHRVFEKFFRADNAIAMVPDGTGLGLSLVKSIVLAWNGNIWFVSEEGSGTKFYFTIPLIGMKPRRGEVKLNA